MSKELPGSGGNHIGEAVNVKRYLNPKEERVDDDPDSFDKHILDSFLSADFAEGGSVEEVELPKVGVRGV